MFKDHELNTVADRMLYKYFTFGKPNSGDNRFELIITLESIVVSGQFGSYVLKETGGLEWFLNNVGTEDRFTLNMANNIIYRDFYLGGSYKYLQDQAKEFLSREDYDGAMTYIKAAKIVRDDLDPDTCSADDYHQAVCKELDVIEDSDERAYLVYAPTADWKIQYDGLKAIAVAIRRQYEETKASSSTKATTSDVSIANRVSQASLEI